jgi:cell division protein FtsZ
VITGLSQPFAFEGKKRSERAMKGIEEMKDMADMTILLPYDRLLKMLPIGTTVMIAFETASKTLCDALIEIHDFIIFTTDNSLINGDLETIKIAMQNSGLASGECG